MEAVALQDLLPLLRRHRGVMGTDVRILEHPPTFRHPEDEVEIDRGVRHLQEEELSLGGQELSHVLERSAQATSGMDHVRRYHEVVGVRIEALLFRVLLDVQELVFDEGILGELLLGLHREHPGEVREDVFRPLRGQEGKDGLCHTTDPGTDLEDPEGLVFWQVTDQFGYRFLSDIVVLLEGEAFHVILEDGLPIVLGEDQFHRVHVPLQHVLDLRATTAEEGGFVEELRESLLQLFHPGEDVR